MDTNLAKHHAREQPHVPREHVQPDLVVRGRALREVGQVGADALAEQFKQGRVIRERRARRRRRDHPTEQGREVHRDGRLLPVIVKLQVRGRGNLDGGASLDSLASCARRKHTKTSRRQSGCPLHAFSTNHDSTIEDTPSTSRSPHRSVGRSIVRSLIHPSSASRPVDRARRAGRARSTVVDVHIKIHRVSSRARLARPIIARATNASSSPVRPDRVSPSRIAPASRLGRASVGRASSSSSPRVHRFRRPIPNARTPSSSHRASTYLAARAPSASRSARARILAK